MEQISVQINGQPRSIPGESSVINLLEHLAIKADRVAIEVNKSLVRKRDWNTTTVPAGAQIEIVEFVGGG